MKLKMRKFMKKALRVRYLILLLMVVLVVVVVGLYVKKDLVVNAIELDNVQFSTEGFEEFLGKDEPRFDTTYNTWWIGDTDTKIRGSQAEVAEINGNWWIDGTDTGIKATMDQNKLVSENDKYIMFIDEMTTIVTIVDKRSLKAGGDKNNPNDYIIKYSSAMANGNAAVKSNFVLSYASTDIAKPVNNEINAFSQSVNYVDLFSGTVQRHYNIKYIPEEKAVQLYYTIGNFGSSGTYFPTKMYATVYEPARCIYDSDSAYQEAVAEYEADYLPTVKSLDNTFEERFRGNVQINFIPKRDKATGTAIVNPSSTIIVHNQEARDYLINTVLPEMGAAGVDVSMERDGISYDLTDEASRQELLLALDAEALEAFKVSKSEAKFPAVKWQIKVPKELVDIYGEYYKKYFNNADSPLTNNPFLSSVDYDYISGSYYSLNLADNKTLFYDVYSLEIKAGPSAKDLYNNLYSKEQKIEKVPGKNAQTYSYFIMKDGEQIPYSSSGYVAKDSEGNYIYDENGLVTQQLYSAEQLEADNALFEIETEGLSVFKIALEFKLTEDGYKITVPTESLVDSTNVAEKLSKDDQYYRLINGKYQIISVKICPYMTYLDSTQQGYTIVPDGSGAIIEFNNGKNGSSISGNYYGKDGAYVDMIEKGDNANLLLGMFAFVNTTPENPSGLIAAIEKGGGQFSLTAGITTNGINYASITGELRSKETIRTGTASSRTQFDKYDKILSPSDLVVNYIIAEEGNLDYSSIAKLYQNYLIKRDNLELKDTSNELLNDLTFLGAFDQFALLFGIKYTTTGTLTTFDQAQEIMDELIAKNVKNLSVSYKGWTSENLEYELGGALKVARKLGKTTSITKFYEYCVEKGASFYPELSITTAKGYDYSFGSLKYTSRGVGNEEAVHYPYDLATGRQDKKLAATYAISPLFYKNITSDIIEDFNKLGVWSSKSNGGFLLTDLGNQWSGNYRKGKQVYGGDAIVYQQESLSMLAEGSKIKIEAPCDYAFKYVDIATNVPVASTMYTVYDGTIPFYQLVVNGLFDYTTENINGLSNRSSAYYFAKALETGSNLSYMLSAEDPAILLETDYTEYYQAYYQNWKDTIIDFTNKINELNIHNCYLTSHEIIKVDSNSLSKVTYTNKTNANEQIVLLVNVSNKSVTYNGTTIPSYGFIKGN